MPVYELFEDKIEKTKNEFLKGELKKASQIPSRSILFNIDQKADVISKVSVDALLSVFVKVFDEACGYYGKQGYIAQFERDMNNRGVFDSFKSKYQYIAGKPWEKGREEAIIENANISKAYAEATNTDITEAKDILDKYRRDYKVSIEDFADQIKKYIDSQGAHFRLNFFVDEVGQYIAENVKLMTNLQTIAETLATKCKGRAWIIVTAQEDMTNVVGEMSKKQGMDFSKIQARFKTRMKLTSADVAEVIQKRLLTKKQEFHKPLETLYEKEKNNFKTLFCFVDGSTTYRGFRDEEHFIYSYPFIPYQYDLFQSAIQNLSDHNAFEGRHSSVGERSMLGVFQEVAKQINNSELGTLATFDLMFEGIRTVLKTQVQASITKAEKNLGNPRAVQLLKALFLVKYVREFKSTIRNLSILMLEHFGEDIVKQQKELQGLLELLENESLIQRTGDIYEFLTNDEQDIEEEIKNTDIDDSDVLNFLGDEIFGLIGENKIIYEDNNQPYSFAKKIDDQLLGKDNELTLNIVTPLNEFKSIEHISSHKLALPELSIVLPDDNRFISDIRLYKKTEKYIRQNTRTAENETKRNIINVKAQTNSERISSIRLNLKQLLPQSQVLIAGELITLKTSDSKTLIKEAFNELIRRIYPNLQMVKGSYNEAKVREELRKQTELFSTEMSEAEQEILGAISRNKQLGVRTTLKVLIETFEKKPFGWYMYAILGNIAKLVSKGKIEAQLDGATVDDRDRLYEYLTNNRFQPNLILYPQIEYSQSEVRAVKNFFQDMFDQQLDSSDAKDIAAAIVAEFKKLQDECKYMIRESTVYPFLNQLAPLQEKITLVSSKPASFFFKEFSDLADELLSLKQDMLSPVRQFMNGAQKDIYDEAYALVTNEKHNVGADGQETLKQIQSILNDPACFRGTKIQQLKPLIESLSDSIKLSLEKEKEKATKSIQEKIEKINQTQGVNQLKPEEKERIIQPLNNIQKQISESHLLFEIQAMDHAVHTEYVEAIQNIAKSTESPVAKGSTNSAPTKAIESVSARNIVSPYSKTYLETETDVDDYLDSLKEAYLKEIQQHKRIIV